MFFLSQHVAAINGIQVAPFNLHLPYNRLSASQVLASGPGGMVDSVFTEARIVNWTLFDVEASSRDF